MRILLLSLLLTGCASIPPETVTLSEEVSSGILKSRQADSRLIDLYIESRRDATDKIIRFVWAPRMIREMVKQAKFNTVICKIEGEFDQAMEVQEFVEDASKEMEAKRAREFAKIYDEETELRRRMREHYNLLESASRAVTANLQSSSERLKLEDRLRREVGKSVNEVIPLDKIKKFTGEE